MLFESQIQDNLYTNIQQFVTVCSRGSFLKHLLVPPAPCQLCSCCCYNPSVPHATPEMTKSLNKPCYISYISNYFRTEMHVLKKMVYQANRWSKTSRNFNIMCFHNKACDLLPVISLRSNHCRHSGQPCFL